MIHPIFRHINNLFALSIKANVGDSTRDSLDEYYMPTIEIKDVIILIDNKTLFNQTIKSKQEASKNYCKCQETMTINMKLIRLFIPSNTL